VSATPIIDRPIAPVETPHDHDAPHNGDALCHLFYGGAAFSHCGVPREEQPPHGGLRGGAYWATPYCAARGTKRCPQCAKASREGAPR
jgi:hypothetical protein